MSRLIELANELGNVEQQVSFLNEKIKTIKVEMAKELGVTVPVVVKEPKAEVEVVERRGRPSMKSLLKSILAEHPEGLDLGGLVVIVVEKIKAGLYSSQASNIGAVVAQAVTALKAEKTINHNRENKVYTLNNAA